MLRVSAIIFGDDENGVCQPKPRLFRVTIEVVSDLCPGRIKCSEYDLKLLRIIDRGTRVLK